MGKKKTNGKDDKSKKPKCADVCGRSHAAARLLSFVFINVAFFAIRTGFDGVKIDIDDEATIIITRKLFTAFGG